MLAQHAPLSMNITLQSNQSFILSASSLRINFAARSTRYPPHLEVGLLQDAQQLVGCLAPVCERAELLEDVLDQLHVVLPHCFQLGLLKLLMGLNLDEDKADVPYGIPPLLYARITAVYTTHHLSASPK